MAMSGVNPVCHHEESELRTSCESEMEMNEVNPACHHQESQLLTSCELEMAMIQVNPVIIRNHNHAPAVSQKWT